MSQVFGHFWTRPARQYRAMPAPAGGGGPVYGNIVSAVIDPRGWAINITVTAAAFAAGNFAGYALDPDGAPKMTVMCSHAGFSPAGGIAVADIKTRTIIGTKAVRKPATYTGIVVNAVALQETDNGNGTVTIKISLSETILATISADGGDYGLTLNLAPGWRAGDAGCTSVPVTNNSVVLMPRPGHRWADVPCRRVTGNIIRASIVAFTFHPYNLRGIAAAKFTMRDTAGTVKTVWTTNLTTSTTYGDNTRLYEVDLDVSGGTAFVAGLVRIDCELYPWLGVMRSTDNGTGMASLASVACETPSQRPDCVAYDPAGTRYRTGKDFICIDPVNGTPTAASVNVAASWALASGTPATCAMDFATALLAGYLANRAISGLTRPLDGMVFGFVAGTHTDPNIANINFTGQIGTTAETWLTLMGDPGDANPSVNCVQNTGTVVRPRAAQKWRFTNMTLALGGSGLNSTDPCQFWFDSGSVLRGKTGSETATTGPSSGVVTGITGVWNCWATGAKAWKYGRGWMATGHWRVGLVRGCQTSRQIGAAMSVSNTFIQHLDPFIAVDGGDPFLHVSPYPSPGTDLGAAQDHIQYCVDMRSTDGKAYDGAYVDAATGGTPVRASNLIAFPYISYNFHINNLVERASTRTDNFWSSVGEGVNMESYCNMFEGNTLVGQRNSFMFCKPLCSTGAGTAIATDVQRTNWSDLTALRNNVYDKTGEEADREVNDTNLVDNNTRNTGVALGYSPFRVECYGITYGTDCEGNVNYGRLKSGDVNNYQEYLGRNSVLNSGVGNANAYKLDAKYTNDLSVNGPVTNGAARGAGQGDYHPAAGSLALARATRANSDRTLDNVARAATFNAGAL